jgi:3-oxoacyl-(acyl-carrier-protein) synthase
VTREVVITGLGAVSALGRGVDALLAGLTSGRSAIGPLVLLPYEGRCRIAAEVRDDVPPGDELAPATRRRLSRPDRFALAAVREALGDAGLDAAARRDAALVVGATTGGMRETEAAYQRWRTGAAPLARFRFGLRQTQPKECQDNVYWLSAVYEAFLR